VLARRRARRRRRRLSKNAAGVDETSLDQVIDLFRRLRSFLSLLLDRSRHGLTDGFTAVITVHLHELGQVKLRRLQDFNLANVHVLKRVNTGARLFNLLADNLRDELQDEFLQVTRRALARDDFNHLGANLTNLRALRVARALGLIHASLGETDAKHAKRVPIRRLHVNEALNQREPLTNQRANLIRGEIHAREIRQHVFPLHVFALELHLAEALVLVVVQVREGDFKDPSLQAIGSNLFSRKTSFVIVSHPFSNPKRVASRRP